MTPIDELPAAPDPATDSPTEFSAKAAAFVLAQRALPGQMNGALAEIEALAGRVDAYAAGGAYALPYIFDTTTADADPGVGKLRLSSATQNAATVMRLDLTAGGQDVTTLLDSFAASTSAVKGAFRLVKQGDLSKWMTFNMTERAAPSGYRNFTVVCTDSSSASPFANGDPLLLFFQRTGDKGDDAVGALQFLASATVGTAVAQVDFLNIFTSAYDKYIIEVQNFVPSTSNYLLMRFSIAGSVDSASMYSNFGQPSSGGLPTFSQLQMNGDTGTAATYTIEVRNANSSGIKYVGVRGGYNGTLTPTGPRAVLGEGAYRGSSPLSGFRLFFSSASITEGTVRVYGVKNNL